MRPIVRAALDYLDHIFANGGQNAKDLWDILSALRGEDGNNQTSKGTVTIPIRRAAFPLTAKRVDNGEIALVPFSLKAGCVTSHKGYPHVSDHFYRHARWAERAIWGEDSVMKTETDRPVDGDDIVLGISRK